MKVALLCLSSLASVELRVDEVEGLGLTLVASVVRYGAAALRLAALVRISRVKQRLPAMETAPSIVDFDMVRDAESPRLPSADLPRPERLTSSPRMFEVHGREGVESQVSAMSQSSKAMVLGHRLSVLGAGMDLAEAEAASGDEADTDALLPRKSRSEHHPASAFSPHVHSPGQLSPKSGHDVLRELAASSSSSSSSSAEANSPRADMRQVQKVGANTPAVPQSRRASFPNTSANGPL